jgi:phage baseplate assembly protein W
VSARQLLGRGWSFPVTALSAGRIEFADGPEKVAQSIQLILATEPGERVMRPAFGCGLRRYLMAPNSNATRALIRLDVDRALAQFEPRIRVREIRVEPGDDPALVLIGISYVHVRDQRPGNLVFPFFLE